MRASRDELTCLRQMRRSTGQVIESLAHLNDASLQDKSQEGVQERGVVDADGGEEGHVDVRREPEEEDDEDDSREQESEVAAVDPYAIVPHRSLQEEHHGGHDDGSDDRLLASWHAHTHTLALSLALPACASLCLCG